MSEAGDVVVASGSAGAVTDSNIPLRRKSKSPRQARCMNVGPVFLAPPTPSRSSHKRVSPDEKVVEELKIIVEKEEEKEGKHITWKASTKGSVDFIFEIKRTIVDPLSALSIYVDEWHELASGPLLGHCVICLSEEAAPKRQLVLDDTLWKDPQWSHVCEACMNKTKDCVRQLSRMYEESHYNYTVSSWTGLEVECTRTSGVKQRGRVESVRISRGALVAIVAWSKGTSKFSKGIRCWKLKMDNSCLPPLQLFLHPSTPTLSFAIHYKQMQVLNSL